MRSLPDRRDADAASAGSSIVDGKGTAEDIKTIRKVAKAMQKASLCALGQTAPNPTLSAIRHFEHEFTERLLPAADH